MWVILSVIVLSALVGVVFVNMPQFGRLPGENVWLESNARPITGMENFVTYTKRY